MRLSKAIVATLLVVVAGCTAQGQSRQTGAIPYAATRQVQPIGLGANSYALLYSFKGNSDGSTPLAGLIAVGGALYGTTEFGGVSNDGTVFSLDLSGGEHILHSFKGGSDSGNPSGPLTLIGGALYGTTSCDCGASGGAAVFGTLFRINPDGSGYKVLRRFRGQSNGDGAYPGSAPVDIGGVLYGTTIDGGSNGSGTIYKINPNGTRYKVIYNFGNAYSTTDGATPIGPLSVVKGTIYGTTWRGGGKLCPNPGGLPGCGTVYAASASGRERILYRFKGGRNGYYPLSGLLNIKGTFYGTTDSGGNSVGPQCPGGCGVAFTLSASGREHVIHRFEEGTDGARPDSGLVQMNGALYGTLMYGPTSGAQVGTVFKMTSAGAVSVIHQFAGLPGSDGGQPNGFAILNHKLYGTTQLGSANSSDPGNGYGTVFSIAP